MHTSDGATQKRKRFASRRGGKGHATGAREADDERGEAQREEHQPAA